MNYVLTEASHGNKLCVIAWRQSSFVPMKENEAMLHNENEIRSIIKSLQYVILSSNWTRFHELNSFCIPPTSVQGISTFLSKFWSTAWQKLDYQITFISVNSKTFFKQSKLHATGLQNSLYYSHPSCQDTLLN